MSSVTYHAATRGTGSPAAGTIDYVCRAIRMHRERLNLSQPQLGALLGVSGFSVGAWERGEARPSSDDIDRLAAYFRVASVALRSPYSSPPRETVLAAASWLQEAR